MKYKLISSERSPFGRICRLLMITNKIPFDFQILNFVDNPKDAETLSRESPINKIPILVVDNAQKIFDSRVIVNYLNHTHGLKPLSVEEENIVSAIYSCLDVSVILFLMKMNGYDLNADNGYLRRQKERIPRNLAYIEAWARTCADWNYASMSLVSFLHWAETRAGTIQLSDHPTMQDFLKKFADAPGVQETKK